MSEEEKESSGGVWQTLKDAVKDGVGSKDGGASDEDAEAGAEGSEGSGEASGDDEGEEKDEYQLAQEKVEALEDDPPQDLSEWPDDQAKYETFGGSDSQAYDEGATQNLGPPSLRRYSDGTVEIEGEAVDNPDEYKGPPIKGGPTDPSVAESEVDPPEEKYGDEGSGGEAGSGEGGDSDAEESEEASTAS